MIKMEIIKKTSFPGRHEVSRARLSWNSHWIPCRKVARSDLSLEQSGEEERVGIVENDSCSIDAVELAAYSEKAGRMIADHFSKQVFCLDFCEVNELSTHTLNCTYLVYQQASNKTQPTAC